MNSYIIAAMVIGGGFAAVLVIIWTYGHVKKEEGKLEVQREIERKSREAISRANDVLAERRDPADANKRLRDGDF